MQKAGLPGWRVEIDEPADLHQLMFVRDACRITDEESVGPPRLDVELPDLSYLIEPAERHDALVAWAAWWGEALGRRIDAGESAIGSATVSRTLRTATRDSGHFSAVNGDGALRQLVAETFDAFRAWWSPQRDGVEQESSGPRFEGVRGQLFRLHYGNRVLPDLISELEHERGHRLQFSFSIETLAVAQPEVLTRAPGYALIAASTMADDDRYRAWLRAELAAT